MLSRLGVCGSLSEKHYIGLDIAASENNGKLRPISRVTLLLDDENALTAGDDTGLEITADCPHATQEMVNHLLAVLKGYQHQMYRADAVMLDPAAELGDGVTVDGLYSVIARIDDDGSGYPDVAAPGEAELEDEYPSAGPMTQELTRKLAQTRSAITKTAEQIRLEVENEVKGLSSAFSVQLESITSVVRGLDSAVSSIEQWADSLTLSVENGDTSSTIALKAGEAVIASKDITFKGIVTFAGLANGTTTIDGACIKTGTIAAERLELTGAITWGDLDSDTKSAINTASTTANNAYSRANSAYALASSAQVPDYIKSTYIDSATVRSPTIEGGTVSGAEIYFGVGGSVGKLFANYGFNGDSYTDLVQLGSNAGIAIIATTNIRIGGNSLWLDVEADNIRVRKNGAWVKLAAI